MAEKIAVILSPDGNTVVNMIVVPNTDGELGTAWAGAQFERLSVIQLALGIGIGWHRSVLGVYTPPT